MEMRQCLKLPHLEKLQNSMRMQVQTQAGYTWIMAQRALVQSAINLQELRQVEHCFHLIHQRQHLQRKSSGIIKFTQAHKSQSQSQLRSNGMTCSSWRQIDKQFSRTIQQVTRLSLWSMQSQPIQSLCLTYYNRFTIKETIKWVGQIQRWTRLINQGTNI